MRATHVCPKCKHNEILFCPKIADRDDDDTVLPLSLHVVHSSYRDDQEFGHLQAYVCVKCGFTELYTTGIEKIPMDKMPGAKLLRGPKA
jgi:predicted nucleic-acid-binding Zn-ribbon protein